MAENKFKFELIDTYHYEKDNKKLSILTCWCKYGFVQQFFVDREIALKLIEFTEKNHSKDITQFINVYWNRKIQNFSYSIEI